MADSLDTTPDADAMQRGARVALEQRRQFNAIDVQYACKIDLIDSV